MNRCVHIAQEALEYVKHINPNDAIEALSLFQRACDIHHISVDDDVAKQLIVRGTHTMVMVFNDTLMRNATVIQAGDAALSLPTLYERLLDDCDPFKTINFDGLEGQIFALLLVLQAPIDIVQLTRLIDDETVDEIDVDACVRNFEPFTLIDGSHVHPFPRVFIEWFEGNLNIQVAPDLGHRMIARLLERYPNRLYEAGYLIRFGAYHMLASQAVDVIDQMLEHQSERFLDALTSAFVHCLIQDDVTIVYEEIARLALDGYADEWLIEDTVQKLSEASYVEIAKAFLKRLTVGLSDMFLENQYGKLALFVGDRDTAQTHFENVIALAEATNNIMRSMSDVSFAHEFLGEIAAEMGDSDKARYHFNACLESIETLAHEDDRFDHEIHRAALSLHQGDLAFDVDDYRVALQHYVSALTVYERMPAPHADAHSSVATTLLKILDAYDALEDIYQAEITIERLLDHVKFRSEKEDSIASFQDLAYVYARLGDRAEGLTDIETALKHYQEVNRLYTHIHTIVFSSESAQDVAFSHARLGELRTLQGNRKMAEKHKIAALYHAERALAEKENTVTRLNVEMHCSRLGEFYFQQTALSKAKRYFERAFQSAQVTTSKDPSFEAYESYAQTASNLGDYYNQRDEANQALLYYNKMVEAEKEALNLAPDPNAQNHQFAYTCIRLGDYHMSHQRIEKAKPFYEEAMMRLERLVTDYDSDAAKALLANVYMQSSEVYKHLGDKKREKRYWNLAKKLNPMAFD